MENRINGLHHITVLASDARANHDFYTKVLGLRMVKKTVNFDAPDVYHLYFADEHGTPGTVLTFFPFADAAPGVRGTGEANAVVFSVPRGSLEFWEEHLAAQESVEVENMEIFGRNHLMFHDPDGLRLEITEDDVQDMPGWQTPEIPRGHSIRKFFGTRVMLTEDGPTRKMLTDTMGLSEFAEENGTTRFVSGDGSHRAFFDIQVNAGGRAARQSAGSIHHIAWRTADDENQIGWRKKLSENGLRVTPVIDRQYFHSVYFTEPGGVLFEIATDNPGFAVDESPDELGSALKLPARYEAHRNQLEALLPPLANEGKVLEGAEK